MPLRSPTCSIDPLIENQGNDRLPSVSEKEIHTPGASGDLSIEGSAERLTWEVIVREMPVAIGHRHHGIQESGLPVLDRGIVQNDQPALGRSRPGFPI
jgi:hypothetical protein